MLHPSEARARLEIVKTAIKRLLEAEGPKTRRELFHSDSRQSVHPTWHRQVLAELERRGLVERTGTSRGVRYAVVDIDGYGKNANNVNSYHELSRITQHTTAIEALLKAAIAASRPVRAEQDNDMDDSAEVPAETPDDPVFQVLCAIAENVVCIRECVETFDQRLQRLEAVWFSDDTPMETSSGARSDSVEEVDGP